MTLQQLELEASVLMQASMCGLNCDRAAAVLTKALQVMDGPLSVELDGGHEKSDALPPVSGLLCEVVRRLALPMSRVACQVVRSTISTALWPVLLSKACVHVGWCPCSVLAA